MNWVEDYIDKYYLWLKEQTQISKDLQSGWFSVTTPFIGLFNDPIEIYLKKIDSDIIISDDGQTLKNLELVGSGISHSPKRKEWLEYIMLNFGITIENDELYVKAQENNFAQKNHNLISAIAEISDLEVTAKHIVSSLFREDVKQLLDEQQIIYTPQFITKGSTGLDFTFDFQIAGQDKELVIKSFNSLNKMNVPNFLFSLDDIKPLREKTSGKELLSLAFVNNIDRDIKNEFVSALESRNTNVVLWTDRHKVDNIKKLKLNAS